MLIGVGYSKYFFAKMYFIGIIIFFNNVEFVLFFEISNISNMAYL